MSSMRIQCLGVCQFSRLGGLYFKWSTRETHCFDVQLLIIILSITAESFAEYLFELSSDTGDSSDIGELPP